MISTRVRSVGRSSASLLAAALVLAACQERVRRPAGDELPFPAVEASAMDRAAAPCQDFYQYACGRWVAETPIPADRTRWVRGPGEREERDLRLLRRVLEEAAAGKVDPQERFGRKAGDFYSACMDEPDVEARGPAELQAEWARLDAISGRDELAAALARLEAMGLEVPFRVRAATDPVDPHRALLALEAGAGGLDPALWRSAQPEAVALRAAYADHVRAALRLAGLAEGQLEAAAADAIALESALLGASAPMELQRLDRAALERLVPGFPWKVLLRTLGVGARTPLALPDPGLAAAAGRLFQEAPLEQWRAYLRWRLTAAMGEARAVHAAVTEEQLRFQAALGPVPGEVRPRWKHCVDLTSRAFAFVTGTAFGRRHLGIVGRERAGELVSEVTAGMQSALLGARWLDAATRTRAAQKLDRLQVQAGFPDAGPDYERLRVGRTSFFRNVLSARRFAVAAEVARAERPVDRTEWLVGAAAPAPVYAADRNTLFVPAGALQPPVYDRDAPAAVRFGAMGAELGRAVAEALHGAGTSRGPEGEQAAWWSPQAERQFVAAEECLADQYRTYRAGPGATAAGGGDLDTGRAMAELAGLRAAWEALHASERAQAEEPPRLLGLGADQQFFLAWAQARCTAVAPAGAAAPQLDDAPVRFGVNGLLANVPAFARAFRCGERAPLARPEGGRCKAW